MNIAEFEAASVYILDIPYHADRAFDYFIPLTMRGQIRIGGFVHVPFGGGNKPKLGLVTALHSDIKERELKPISSPVPLLSDNVALNAEMLGLCFFIKEHTFCSMGEAVKSIIPPAALSKLEEIFRAVSRPAAFSSRTAELMFEKIAQTDGISMQALSRTFGNDTAVLLSDLINSGAVLRDVETRDPSNIRYVNMIELAIDTDEAQAYADRRKSLRSDAYRTVISELLSKSDYKAPAAELSANLSQLRAMSDRGYVKIVKIDLYRDPYTDREAPTPDHLPLTEEQSNADEAIGALLATGEPKAALLHGVTGSGKTRVIKAAIDRVLAMGRQVIVLVPEISLTPQTVGFFRSYYADRIAVVHSSLSAGERFDAWRRMKRGDADICIGTRSAVFAPFENLGMIVIDEEQEHTYKSDMNPKYHARDIARYRCAKHNALMLLSSATPSIESYYKAKSGIYSLIELKHRYSDSGLPTTEMADLRNDAKQGNTSPLGSVLLSAISDTLARGEQVILFLNRRGYNSFLSCGICGEVLTCPHCSVSLTFHTRGKLRQDEGETLAHAHLKRGYLTCHYCGYRMKVPEACPSCGNPNLGYTGAGTQRIEEELERAFPDARIMRLDADTTQSKFAYEQMLDDFRAEKADIMLGTQMVTKGHDFPGVTLVGVLLADSSLFVDDFRAGEKTFSLMTQVIGRAGRADKSGRAIVQTNSPENPVLLLAAKQDYEAFYENEILQRRAYLFPPFCDMALITLTGSHENELLTAAADYDRHIKELLERDPAYRDLQLVMFGPIEAPIYKINEKYRLRFIFKCRSDIKTRSLLARMMREEGAKFGKKITITTDINPNSL